MTVGLVLSYLVLGAFAGLIYRTALGGLILGAGALVMFGLALAVAWASAKRRAHATEPERGSARTDDVRPRTW